MTEFGARVPVRNKAGETTGTKASVVRRITREPLNGSFGADSHRKIVVSLCDGDVIAVRPLRRRAAMTVTAHVLYRMLVKLKTGAWFE